MKQYVITQKYGYFRDSRGPTANIYQAVGEIPCAGCGHAIQPGELLTRHHRGPHDPPVSPKGKRPSAQVYCQQCYPFTVTGEYGRG